MSTMTATLCGELEIDERKVDLAKREYRRMFVEYERRLAAYEKQAAE